MKCQQCGHENEGGRFCENCGNPLIETTGNETQQVVPQVNNEHTGTSQTDDYLKKIINHSKQYFTYFMDVLKKPYVSLHASGGNQHFIYAIITFVLYSFLIPLLIYFGLNAIIDKVSALTFSFGTSIDVTLPFMDVVIKPFLGLGLFMILVIAFTYISIKLGRINVTFKEVFTRFGMLLIPFVTILVIGLLLSILEVSLFIYFLVIGLMGSIFIAVPMLIVFYKKQSTEEGLDVLYGTLLTYVLTFIVVLIMGEMLFDSLITSIQSYFGGY